MGNLIAIEAHHICTCGTKSSAPPQVNSHHEEHMKLDPEMKVAGIKHDETLAQDSKKVEISCPDCGNVWYTYKQKPDPKTKEDNDKNL